jgi:Zn-dependent protease with chaperone function
MLDLLFLCLAIGYNWRKFGRERAAFMTSLIEAKESSHREMILSHHFYIFIFEAFLSLIVGHIISERSFEIGILGLGILYLVLLGFGFIFYQYFLKYVERQTNLLLRQSFNQHLIKEIRVNFAMIMLPILIYSIINWTFLDEVYNEWGSFWFIGFFFNIIFVSVLTIVCTVVIMLRLIPNREISEPAYLEIINKRLEQINLPHMRVRWIETDIKNAFVVGLKLLRFSNQTMFVGKNLRTMLTIEEFDAVIAHELAHVANRHIHKRIIDLIKNLFSIIFCVGLIFVVGAVLPYLYWGEDAEIHTSMTVYIFVIGTMGSVLLNYSMLFDTIRSHEYEADAYAVLNMGAKAEALISALEKLDAPGEIPEYLKSKTKKNTSNNPIVLRIKKVFSTHPSIEERKLSLYNKIQNGLPFNHYFSGVQKIRLKLAKTFTWKLTLPLAIGFVAFCSVSFWRYQEGDRLISYIQNSSSGMIIKNKKISAEINSKSGPFGRTLMYHVVQKKDAALINHFLLAGAEKGRTLIYISELKDAELFTRYYHQLSGDITLDEYHLLLRKTARNDFTEGFRLLVNGKMFEVIGPHDKAEIARIREHSKRDRKPASIK